MNYIAYYRTSTKSQNLGIEAQQETVRRFLKQSDNVIAEYQEQESGKNNNRRELLKAIDHAKREDATLLIAKLDRLSRNLSFISQLMDNKVKFIACDMPEANEFTIHIFGALAQQERKLISGRTKDGLESIKRKIEEEGYYISKKGNIIKRLGGTKTEQLRLGPKARQKMAAENNKQLVHTITLLRERGDTFRLIAETLNDKGYRTPNGKLFTTTYVHRLYTTQHENIL